MKMTPVLPYKWRLVACLQLVLQVFYFPRALLWAATPPDSQSQPAVPIEENGVSHPAPANTPVGINPIISAPVNAEPPARTEFSPAPTDAEIVNCRIFEEPLCLIGGTSTPGEDADLAAAITAFEDRQVAEDFSALAGFVRAHPQSPWNAALQLNLGMWYAHDCFYGRAFRALVEAWDLSKSEAAMPGKGVGDRAAAELAEVYAGLGCTEALSGILEEIKNRDILGSARQKIVGAREMLGFINEHPDHAYNCGPLAMDLLWRNKKQKRDHLNMLFDPEEGTVGRNLNQLADLSKKAGTPMVPVRRPVGAAFPIPCLVHWKTQHFDSLIERQGDRYRLRNPFLNHDIWVSAAALEEETTGFILVPADKVPSGWKKVTSKDGKAVWGGCHTGTADGNNTDPCQKSTNPGCHGGRGMAYYTIQLALVNLHISDTPVGYSPARGPAIDFQVNYNHREANQPETFNYSNLGRLWTFKWLSYVNDNNNTGLDASVSIYEMGGGTKVFSFASESNTSKANPEDNSFLVRTTGPGGFTVTGYVRHFSDGSQTYYTQATTGAMVRRKVFLSSIQDSQGNTVTLGYDNQFRLTSIWDAVGLQTKISYGPPANSYQISSVTDPFNRSASFTYTASGQLETITDTVGIVSRFSYQGDFIQKLTTPYGDTTFSAGETGADTTTVRWLNVTDPMGGREKVLYHQDDFPQAVADWDPALSAGANDALNLPLSKSNATPSGLMIANDRVSTRNTFYWDKKAMMTAPDDYSQAHVYHWLHDEATQRITDILESEKTAGGSRVWYNYPGQPSPFYEIGTSSNVTKAGQFVDAQNTLQLVQYEYNAQGNPTKAIDPLGRTTTYVYDATGIDLLEIHNKFGTTDELLAKFTYTDPATQPVSIHQPLTVTDAAGQVTTMTFTTHGQPFTRKVVRKGQPEITTWNYYPDNDPNTPRAGRLWSITGPVTGATVTFDYDICGRVKTVTDSENYSVTYDYDNLDRVIMVSYPDKTYEQINYDKLEPEWQRDRMGRWTHLFHDNLGRVSQAVDPAGRVTKYDWCVCGALHGFTDGEGHTTKFDYDIEKRVTKKTYQDATALQFTYDPFRGLLTQRTDANGRSKNYTYNLDDSLQQISYAGGVVSTPGVSFTYDPNHPRLKSMKDGTGITSYEYYPIDGMTLGAGQLKTVTPPLANAAVTYTYDELGRELSSAISGVASSWTFDALGRVDTATNLLGGFVFSYLNTTNRLKTMTYPNSLTTGYSYYDNVPAVANTGTGNGDQRLQTIWNKRSAVVTLSKHDYSYDSVGQIASWTQQTDNAPALENDFGYDSGDQLLDVIIKDPIANAVKKHYGYGYDRAGNRLIEQVTDAVAGTGPKSSGSGYNGVNHLTARSGAGPTLFEGTVNKLSTVTVGGQPAVIDSNNRFRATVNVSPGSQNVEIKATDVAGRTTTRRAQVTIPTGGPDQQFTYDNDGNLTGDGLRTFAWDAENRLVKVTKGNDVQEFVWNGSGQRVAEKRNDAVTKQWVWDGTELREERTADNSVTKRFYSGGVVLGPEAASPAAENRLCYTRDHLGSIREVVDGTGALRARYDFDAWGRRSTNQVPGASAVETDFAYTGHYWDDFAGVYLAYFRVYDPDLGRWLSRDPISEEGGINLYGYVGNGPLGAIDPFGLSWLDWEIPPWLVNGTAGAADALSFGITDKLRGAVGANDVVDKCGGAYKGGYTSGTVLGLATGGGRLAYAGIAKANSMRLLAQGATRTNALKALAARNTMKNVFNLGINTNKPTSVTFMLEKYGTDWASWIRAAGRTGTETTFFGISYNHIGAWLFAAGLNASAHKPCK